MFKKVVDNGSNSYRGTNKCKDRGYLSYGESFGDKYDTVLMELPLSYNPSYYEF